MQQITNLRKKKRNKTTTKNGTRYTTITKNIGQHTKPANLGKHYPNNGNKSNQEHPGYPPKNKQPNHMTNFKNKWKIPKERRGTNGISSETSDKKGTQYRQ